MRLPVLALLVALTPACVALAQMPTTPGDAKLPPGHPSVGDMQLAPKTQEMNHSGSVQETIAASPYVYIRAKTAEGDIWLAGPSLELKNGQEIRWPEGMPMKNFFSKTLQRTFDVVYFVNAVELVGAK
ncbi:MAG TPA: hypothetical protein HPP80_10840 [Rhodospirillaceae bacterium]|nr:hypothetical protein [Rhodospirillaceae bacterium]